MPPSRRAPKKLRVLWEAPGGEGRYADIEASSDGEAAWNVAIALEGGSFTGIIPVPATEG
jgi:hypothetical protein